MHLEESTGGQIIFNNEDVTQLSKKGLKEYHSHAQMIFQDPYSSLDPRYTIEDAIREPLMISGKYNRMQAQKKTEELMDLVGIARRLRMAYLMSWMADVVRELELLVRWLWIRNL